MLTVDEFYAMLPQCLGLRVSEIIALQGGDFDFEELTSLVLRREFGCHNVCSGKNLQARRIPLSQLSERRLERNTQLAKRYLKRPNHVRNIGECASASPVPRQNSAPPQNE